MLSTLLMSRHVWQLEMPVDLSFNLKRKIAYSKVIFEGVKALFPCNNAQY